MPCTARLIGSVDRRSRRDASSQRRAAASDRSNSPRPSCTADSCRSTTAIVARAPSATASRRRFLEPVEVERDEQVDGAELLQRPHAPQGQPGRRGDVVRLLERRLGRRRVAAAFGPTEHLERLALDLRLARSRARPATPPWPEPRRPRRRRGAIAACAASALARARRATSGASAAAASACSLGTIPATGGQVGGPHEQVHRGLVGGIAAPLQQLGAERAGPFRVPGEHADLAAGRRRRRRPASRWRDSRARVANASADASAP